MPYVQSFSNIKNNTMGYLSVKQQMRLYREYRNDMDLSEKQDGTLIDFINIFPGLSFVDVIDLRIEHTVDGSFIVKRFSLSREDEEDTEDAIRMILDVVRSASDEVRESNFENIERSGKIFLRNFEIKSTIEDTYNVLIVRPTNNTERRDAIFRRMQEMRARRVM